MIGEHWFWALLLLAVFVRYSTTTVYVAIRGDLDVRQMLRDLGRKSNPDDPWDSSHRPPDRRP